MTREILDALIVYGVSSLVAAGLLWGAYQLLVVDAQIDLEDRCPLEPGEEEICEA